MGRAGQGGEAAFRWLVESFAERPEGSGESVEVRSRLSEDAAAAESPGDGSPFRQRALEQCWPRCQSYQGSVAASTNPAAISRARITSESGISADRNPYFGLTQDKLDAVIRAAFTSRQPPEVLLALWAKEGSHRMLSGAQPVPGATTAARAKAIFRSRVYYEDLGADHFLVTTRPAAGGDNVWDDGDGAATGHETHFARTVADLVTAGILSEDLSAAVNAELTTSAAAPFTVTPSVKFYALSLLLVDALFTQMQRNTFPQVTSISPALNYLQWNMGTASFGRFLVSAETHRQEAAHRLPSGGPMPLEQWALRTRPAATEYRQARANAIRFMHYADSYRPIFSQWMNLITPGIEDLALPGNVG